MLSIKKHSKELESMVADLESSAIGLFGWASPSERVLEKVEGYWHLGW